jgi:ankyrin repeat protein
MAVENSNVEVVDVLLKSGANCEVKTSDGLPPLWYALKSTQHFSDNSLPEKLISHGASPSAVSSLRRFHKGIVLLKNRQFKCNELQNER